MVQAEADNDVLQEHLGAIRRLLSLRGGIEVVNFHAEDAGQLRVTGRVKSGAMNRWVWFSEHLLRRSKSSDWGVDVSRPYFLRNDGGREQMFYAWRIIFEGKDSNALVAAVRDVLQTMPEGPAVELTEFPVVGLRRNG